MSRRTDGTYHCDRCGVDVDNGGVVSCAAVSDLDPVNVGTVRVLHFCRGDEDTVGCVSIVLSDSNLADYLENSP